ncbi:hypothetical protein K0B96_13365 [Horticoccus luteus]|uniref:PEP-CTERM protein-sorting domain-containing protein n=1 Tax=Horticoccus luteus TaxID=2862869 RepID=A0A8F9TU14_9BACT|nr:hypothetical protein [Horticoccus luteus]QYM78283.1 hypothetical protein K0B96_13365 [Horticoccus luteus]
MKNARFPVRVLLLVVAALLPLPAAQALIIYGGSAGHITDPGYGLPWANVGDTGIYLGAFDTGNWVITANHVGSAGIVLNGTAYASVAGSAQRIGTSDLLLYRLDVSSAGAPDLPTLTFSASTPSIGQPIVMIGDGGGTKAWATNTVEQYAFYNLVADGPTTLGLITTASEVAGEGQGQSGDSGGAIFYQTGPSSWLLCGVLSAIGTDNGTSFTASAAVGYYYNDIANLVGTPIPEPTTCALLLGALSLAAALRHRHHSAKRARRHPERSSA